MISQFQKLPLQIINPNIQTDFVIVNSENFKLAKYNSLDIIIREQDGFVNATKMVDKINQLNQDKTQKQFRVILQNKDFKEYVEVLKEYIKETGSDENPSDLFYELGPKYTEVKGTFIHPLLINYVAQWANKKYALMVSIIMNYMNVAEDKQQIAQLKQCIQHLQDNQPKGFIYCFSNEEGIYKIGCTNDLQRRLKEANNTYTRIPFQIVLQKQINLKQIFSLEHLIHHRLRQYRESKDKEFFKCGLNIIKQEFDLIDKINTQDFIELIKYLELEPYSSIKEQKSRQKIIDQLRAEYNITEQFKQTQTILQFFQENYEQVEDKQKYILLKDLCDEYYQKYGIKHPVKNVIGQFENVIDSFHITEDGKRKTLRFLLFGYKKKE